MTDRVSGPGGLSSGAVLGIVAGGAAVAGAAVAISSNNNNETTSTTSAVTQPPVTTQASATTTTTTTTTLPTQPFSASFGISPNPPNGKEPLAVTFDECASTGVDLKFIYDFAGDGNEVKAGCNETRVYRLSGVSSSVVTTLPPATRAFDAVVCVGQAARKECHNWHIVVSENTLRHGLVV